MKKIREKGKKGGTHGGIFLGEGKNLEIYFTQESILYHVPNLDSVTWRLKYVQNKLFFGVKKIQEDTNTRCTILGSILSVKHVWDFSH